MRALGILWAVGDEFGVGKLGRVRILFIWFEFGDGTFVLHAAMSRPENLPIIAERRGYGSNSSGERVERYVGWCYAGVGGSWVGRVCESV